MKTNLSAERLRQVLDYDCETGVFSRKLKTTNAVDIGDVAGTTKPNGYVVISVDGELYRAHRLAWLYMHGCWPENHIDHIDGNRANNSISNLRDVPQMTNNQNIRKSHKAAFCNLLGVTKNGKAWMARIKSEGVQHHLGTYETPEFAHGKYLSAKRAMHSGCTI